MSWRFTSDLEIYIAFLRHCEPVASLVSRGNLLPTSATQYAAGYACAARDGRHNMIAIWEKGSRSC